MEGTVVLYMYIHTCTVRVHEASHVLPGYCNSVTFCEMNLGGVVRTSTVRTM